VGLAVCLEAVHGVKGGVSSDAMAGGVLTQVESIEYWIQEPALVGNCRVWEDTCGW
jgi:hypothetical protein